MSRYKSLQEWLKWQEGLNPRIIDLGLERSEGVYRRLNPDNWQPPTITVAGTNGKGSCIAFLEAIYQAQGYKVGAYTSPHIVHYNERIKIDGRAVGDEVICAAFERIDAVRGDQPLSYFEFGTLAALDLFRRAAVDVQLLEVGLGGRLDAVNIVDADVAIVTSICIDHVDWLGETREAIGREKAGIFRRGIPAIIGDINPPHTLLDVAAERHTPLYLIGKDFTFTKTSGSWSWHSGGRSLAGLPRPALQGAHQYRNASAVITAVMQLQRNLTVSDESIRLGLAEVRLAGRFQYIAGEIPVLLDVGHNPQAVKTLLDYLLENFPHVTVHAVFAMMQDKDIGGVIKIIHPVIDKWFIAPLKTARAASESSIRQCLTDNHIDQIFGGFANFSETFAAARQHTKRGEMLVVFGSFFLVSDYLTSHYLQVR